MRLSVYELYDMLPKYFFRMMEGFYDLEIQRENNKWQRCRWQTCLLLNIQLPKNKTLKPQDLFVFDGEKENGIDFKELKARAEYIKKMEDSKNIDNDK